MPEWLAVVLIAIVTLALLILFGSEHLSPYARGRSRVAGRNPATPTQPQLADRYDPVFLQQQEAQEAARHTEST